MEGWRLPSGGCRIRSAHHLRPTVSLVAAMGDLCLALVSDTNRRRRLHKSPRLPLSANREKKILRRNTLTANMEGDGKGALR